MSTSTSAPPGPPFSPSEEWIDAFKSQCTRKLRLDMKHYAKWRSRSVRRANNGYLEDSYAEDLVAEILKDTLAGEVTWIPATKSLYQHVEDMVRRRTYHDRKRALRFKHDRIDAPKSVTEQSNTRTLVQASLAQDQADETPDAAIHAQQMVSRLRGLAASDKPVLQYLDAIVAGARHAEEIMEHASMTKRTFRNARDRLARLLERLEGDSAEQGVRA